jgi:hypothetical protein
VARWATVSQFDQRTSKLETKSDACCNRVSNPPEEWEREDKKLCDRCNQGIVYLLLPRASNSYANSNRPLPPHSPHLSTLHPVRNQAPWPISGRLKGKGNA